MAVLGTWYSVGPGLACHVPLAYSNTHPSVLLCLGYSFRIYCKSSLSLDFLIKLTKCIYMYVNLTKNSNINKKIFQLQVIGHWMWKKCQLMSRECTGEQRIWTVVWRQWVPWLYPHQCDCLGAHLTTIFLLYSCSGALVQSPYSSYPYWKGVPHPKSFLPLTRAQHICSCVGAGLMSNKLLLIGTQPFNSVPCLIMSAFLSALY